MSSSAECWDFFGRRLPEKPSFSQTCSRLSRYLKEKGTFGDLSLGMTCKPEINVSRQPTMMNLFPCEASAMDSSSAAQDIKPNNIFPRQSSFSSSSSSGTKEDVQMIKETKSVNLESQSAPLTIFYGGQVMVFDDFSAEKAKEVVDLANKASVKSFTGFAAEVNTNQSAAYTQTLAKNQKEIASTPNPVRSPAKTASLEPIQPNPSSLACELPIARRASLHRFLEKRKDRITSKAPYQIDGSAEASSKPNSAWLGSR